VPADLRRRLLTVLHGLEVEPRPNGGRKLRDREDLFRLPAGDWRIVYGVQDDRLVVPVIEIAPRGNTYRNL
jgi:mRNA interferase RelE/StbE